MESDFDDDDDDDGSLSPGEQEELQSEHNAKQRRYNQTHKARMERMAKGLPERVFVKGSYLRLMEDPVLLGLTVEEIGESTYDIQLDRANTPEKILAWVCHLSAKNWVTAEMLGMFVAKAAWKAGIQLDHNY